MLRALSSAQLVTGTRVSAIVLQACKLNAMLFLWKADLDLSDVKYYKYYNPISNLPLASNFLEQTISKLPKCCLEDSNLPTTQQSTDTAVLKVLPNVLLARFVSGKLDCAE